MEDNKALSGEVFETAMEYLPRLIDGLERASKHFKNNEKSAGLLIISEASDGLIWFNQMVLGLPVILPQGENTADIKERWQPYMDSLKSTLSHIEKMDVIAITQAIDHEIIPFIKMIYGKIGNLENFNPYEH